MAEADRNRPFCFMLYQYLDRNRYFDPKRQTNPDPFVIIQILMETDSVLLYNGRCREEQTFFNESDV